MSCARPRWNEPANAGEWGWILGALLVTSGACASSSERKVSEPPTVATGPSESELRAREEQRQQQIKREKIVANHRVLESAQQDALGATCKDAELWAKQHCTPSCYPPEPRDARAGTKLAGPVEIQHRVCQRVLDGGEFGPSVVIDEIDNAKLSAKPVRKRAKAQKKGSWQADLATGFSESRKLPRKDQIAVVGTWQTVKHPVTQERLRCVEIAHYTKVSRIKLDACGATGKSACEASGNAAARGINLLHFRLAEARQLQAAGNDTGCRDAALAAVAVARGLPRWRQYAKLNVGDWTEGLAYKTRFDGVLDEDQLFAAATSLGVEADQIYAACSGARAVTTPEQEQSFHSCP